MNNEELDAIRKRAEAATPGPWYRVFGYGINIETESDYKVVDEDGGVAKYPDAEFIAYARQDVPVLLAEVERLQHFEWALQFALDEIKRLQDGD